MRETDGLIRAVRDVPGMHNVTLCFLTERFDCRFFSDPTFRRGHLDRLGAGLFASRNLDVGNAGK